MDIEYARSIKVVRCFTDPDQDRKWSGQECVIRDVSKGWVLIECGAGWFNVRASEVKTLENAIAIGWVSKDSDKLANY